GFAKKKRPKKLTIGNGQPSVLLFDFNLVIIHWGFVTFLVLVGSGVLWNIFLWFRGGRHIIEYLCSGHSGQLCDYSGICVGRTVMQCRSSRRKNTSSSLAARTVTCSMHPGLVGLCDSKACPTRGSVCTFWWAGRLFCAYYVGRYRSKRNPEGLARRTKRS